MILYIIPINPLSHPCKELRAQKTSDGLQVVVPFVIVLGLTCRTGYLEGCKHEYEPVFVFSICSGKPTGGQNTDNLSFSSNISEIHRADNKSKAPRVAPSASSLQLAQPRLNSYKMGRAAFKYTCRRAFRVHLGLT